MTSERRLLLSFLRFYLKMTSRQVIPNSRVYGFTTMQQSSLCPVNKE